jgi:pimeloyl-ACP methyl ester carboxylesterase
VKRHAFSRDDGSTLSAVVRPGDGPTLMLIPGTFSPVAVFDPVVAELNPDTNLVLAEVRGQGGSWPPVWDMVMRDLTEDALEIADRLGLDRFAIGGHSLGGMISIDILDAAPDRITGSISIEGWTHHCVAKDAFADAIVSTLTPEQEQIRMEMRAKIFERWTEEARENHATIWRKWDGLSILEETDVPVVEIWGDRGLQVPTLKAMRIPVKPNIEVVWMNGASHALLMERPSEVAATINSFMTCITQD